MGFSYSGFAIAKISVTGVHGRLGLGLAQLCFSLGFEFHESRVGVLTVDNLQVEVIVGTPRIGPSSVFVGHGIAESPFVARTVPHSDARLVRVTLSEGQILHLEKLRAGRDLEFELSVKAICHGPNGTQQLFETIKVPLNPSAWARVLNELQGPEYLVLGVSLPRCDLDHPLRPAVEKVRSAHEQLINGRYDAAISDCRLALDGIIKSTGVEPKLRELLQAPSVKRVDMSKIERELLLLNALRNYTHMAHHLDPNGKPEYYSRDDAALVVSTTAALVGNSMYKLSSDAE
ncbi:MAG: hypothetical protein K2X75_04460 [Burkholderiaceae bacterium]|nr:hypothetical protein [Burkholderiaceae bacterium]